MKIINDRYISVDSKNQDELSYLEKCYCNRERNRVTVENAVCDACGNVHTDYGINQKRYCDEMMKRSTVLFYLSSSEYIPDFLADIKAAKNAGKRTVCLYSEKDSGFGSSREAYEQITDCKEYVKISSRTCLCPDFSSVEIENAEKDDTYIIGYGDDAVVSFHDLSVPAIIKATPYNIAAKCAANIHTESIPCLIYVPADFNIFNYVSFFERTQITYYQLWILSEKYGDVIYSETPETLAHSYPEYFFNIYDDHIPPAIDNNFQWTEGNFLESRAKYFSEYFAAVGGMKYLHGCFLKETYELTSIEQNCDAPKKQVIVDGIIADRGRKVTVYPGGTGAVSPRKVFFRESGDETSVISNFAFFFTETLKRRYNDLRAERPKEQIIGNVGYIDYYLYTDENGIRHETFPLYKKHCIAYSKDNGFCAFAPALGAGKISFNGLLTLSWEKENINPGDPKEIAIYTPMISEGDSEKDHADYFLKIGENRLNIVIIGEKVFCVRRGDVLLPSVGIVISLTGELADRTETLFGACDGNGYFENVSDVNVSVFLEHPEYEWIYGGGLGLICGNKSMTPDTYEKMCREEGWMTPLSRQTQESSIHTLALHPRTAVGVTKKGELIILVFSGRTVYSEGANYIEMCEIAKRLVDNIDFLINFDGGASSVLGLLHGNVFTEINPTCCCGDNPAGMVRSINSMLRVSLD